VALGEAILICLTERPMSGYELAKSFDTSIGFFWRADHQQIYKELAKLSERGLIEGDEVIQSGKPNKFIYTITTEGTHHLKEWSRQPTRAAAVKDDLLVRLYAVDAVDIGALRADIMARLEWHRDRLMQYERILAKNFTDRDLSDHEKGKLLGLRLGFRYEQNWSEWCEEALELLPLPDNPGDGSGS